MIRTFLSLLFLSFSLTAQVMMTEVDGKQKSLKITQMDFKVRTHGFLAETELTMTFVNPFSRDLIGNFYITLPQKSSITSYALDIKGKLIDAVAVEKIRARQVFEEISRQRIDPGLMEWIKGNSFKTRVYPISAHSSRTIRVKVLSEMTYVDGQFIYEFPLQLSQPLNKIQLQLNCDKQYRQPKVLTKTFKNLNFSKETHSYKAALTLFKVKPDGLKLEIPVDANEWKMVELAKDGQYYFSWAYLFPQVKKLRKLPRSIALFWDASTSRLDSARSKELEFLESLLKRTKDIKVSLTVLRNTPQASKEYDIKQGDCAGLIKDLKNIVYDGGTYLTSKLIKERAANTEEILIFSDGMSSLSYEQLVKSVEQHLTVVNSSVVFDDIFFKRMISKGTVIDLRSRSIKNALDLFFRDNPYYRETETASGIEVYPKKATKVTGFFAISGRLDDAKKGFAVIPKIEDGKEIDYTVNFNTSDVVDGELLRKYFALKKLADLQLSVVPVGIKQHGIEFQMVTPQTSLIVLDNLTQYLRYRIEPPDTLPKMKEDYLEYISANPVDNEDSLNEDDPFGEHVSSWQKFLAWYGREFEYPEDFTWSRELFFVPDYLSSGLLEMIESDDAFSDDLGLGGGDLGAESFAALRERVPEKVDSQQSTARTVVIKTSPWESDSKMLEELGKSKNIYKDYLILKEKFRHSSDFYLDVAHLLLKENEREKAILVASNVAELAIDNTPYLRALAMFFEEMGNFQGALGLYKRIMVLRPDEAQSWRHLALCLYKLDFAFEAISLLNTALKKKFNRFDLSSELKVELSRMVQAHTDLSSLVENSLTINNKMDLRLVLTWNVDNVNLDLIVTEPTGEESSSGYTTIGGFTSELETYGPETYMLKKALRGEYNIAIKLRGDQSQSINGAVRARLDIYTNFGKENEQHLVNYYKLNKKAPVSKSSVIFTVKGRVLKKTTVPKYYIVTRQDNLLRMAAYLKSFNVSWQKFQKANLATDWQNLKYGEKLIIPKSE